MKKIFPLLVAVLVVVGVAIYFSYNISPNTTARQDQTDFVVKDTANVGKIFIADNKGREITLTREPGGWMVNGMYKAREDAAWLLLHTFHNVYIQRPVAKEAQEQVNRVMAGSAKKVEIYDLDGKWIKTWYVGHGTMDKKGTYMLLETPEFGRSAAPYILDMRGFLGMLDTRFFTNLSEWRSTRILEYGDMQLKEVDVSYPSQPETSFKIKFGGGNDIQLFHPKSEEPITRFDTAKVKDYMLNFKLASFENYNTLLTEAQEDSVKNLVPYQIIKVTDANQTREIRLWSRPAPEGQTEIDRTIPATLDRERIYASVNMGELAFAQRLTWDNFKAPIQAFLPEADL